MRHWALAAMLSAGLLAADPATAAAYNRITVAELIAVLENGGHAVTSTENSRILQVGATLIVANQCGRDGRCAEIGFVRNYNNVFPSLAAVNEWNQKMKLPEASVNENGGLHMETWITAIGATDASILDTFAWFEKFVADEEFWGPFIRKV
jgi:hypothetical protein